MTQHRIGKWALSLLVAVGMLGMADGAWGQDQSRVLSQGDVQVVAPSPTDRTFGTASEVAHVIYAYDLGVSAGSAAGAPGPFRSCSGGACSFQGGCSAPGRRAGEPN
jgi:hypothetical protein